MSSLVTLISYRRPHLRQENITVAGSIFISRLTCGFQCRTIFLLLRLLAIMDIFRTVVHEVIDPSSACVRSGYNRFNLIPAFVRRLPCQELWFYTRPESAYDGKKNDDNDGEAGLTVRMYHHIEVYNQPLQKGKEDYHHG